MLIDTPPFKYKDLLLPENQNGFFNIAMKTQTFRHPEVRGHRVFWTRGKRRLHEHSWPFQLEWQSLAGLMQVTFPHAVLGLPGWALSALYTGREVVEKGKAGSCYWHVCISNNTDKKFKKKDYSRCFLTVEGYMCAVALHCWILRPVYSHALKIIVLSLHFFVFLLFCFLASPHSCFLYYFISVRESLWLPPPLSHSFFLHSLLFSPPLLPPSLFLPLPIFACATFNCSDMPCGKLCLCVLEQALLVMAVIPDAKGGV